MKEIPTGWLDKINAGSISLATIWSISRADGVNKYFTDNDRDIFYNGNTYITECGFQRSAIRYTADLAVNNHEVQGYFHPNGITERDVRAGLYNSAYVETSVINFSDPTLGAVTLQTGWMGEWQITNSGFSVEVRGIGALLGGLFGEVYTPTCRAQFGDSRCGKNLASYTFGGIANGDGSARNYFTFSPDGGDLAGHPNERLRFGIVTFIDGDNAGFKTTIVAVNVSNMGCELLIQTPFAIQADTRVTISLGCEKTRPNCKIYGNIANFRGEPDVPGDDALRGGIESGL